MLIVVVTAGVVEKMLWRISFSPDDGSGKREPFLILRRGRAGSLAGLRS